MKKTIRLCSLFLCLCMILTIFSACKSKTDVEWEEYSDVSYVTVSAENGEDASDATTSDTSKKSGTSSKKNTSTKVITELPSSGRFDSLKYSGKTVKLLIWYTPEAWEQQIYDEFQKITGAKIKYVQQGTSDNKLAALIAANDAPDAYMMTQENFPHYIVKKLIQPLDKYIDKSKDTWLAYDLMDKIKYGDEHYGITDHYWGDLFCVYFNKDLFDKNLEVKKNPLELYKSGEWTWDAFYDLASKMTIKNSQGNITQYGSITTRLNLFALSAGANAVTSNNGNFTNTLNSKEMKAAAAMEKKLAAGGYYTDLKGDFAQGNVAMYVYPQYRVRQKGSWANYSFKWDWAPFPTYTGGTNYNPAEYQYGVVPNKAKNPEAGYMLLNYRAYCQENLTTMVDVSSEWKDRYKKVATGKTMASLDLGILGGVWGLYRELADPNSDVQTVIDSWIPKVDGKIRDYEQEKEAYK